MLPGAATTQARSLGHFNRKGNILIVDQLNNRVIEVDTNSHAIVWQFGDGGTVAGPTTIFAPHDAERFGALTYIACTGVPPGGEPGCPSGCPDNRVIAVNKKGRIVWQYGQAGVTGSGANELNNPTSIRVLAHRRFLITDQGNQRVIEVSKRRRTKSPGNMEPPASVAQPAINSTIPPAPNGVTMATSSSPTRATTG